MPSFRTAFPSKYLKAADCVPPLIVEIKSAGFEDIGAGTDVQRKLVLNFVERPQGLVLNVTNCNLLEQVLGTDDYEQWVGKKICLASTKVQYQGKFVDGIRVQPLPTRRSKPLSQRPTPPPAAAAPAEEDAALEDEGPDTEIGF